MYNTHNNEIKVRHFSFSEFEVQKKNWTFSQKILYLFEYKLRFPFLDSISPVLKGSQMKYLSDL